MSQDDVEHMRRGVEHFRRTGEALWAELDPDCELHDYDIPDAEIYRTRISRGSLLAHALR
jgi:hypothetical protein